MKWESKKTPHHDLSYPEFTTGDPEWMAERSERHRAPVKKKFFQHRWIKVMTIVLSCIVALVIVGIILFNNLFGSVKKVQLDEQDLGIQEDAILEEVSEEKLKQIKNIALFGIDTTDGAATIGDQYRSDSIIVFSIDPTENKLKMTSILRDSKVPIEGHDPQKINAAYKYGGAQLAIKTLNQNFKTNIKDYVTVDFAHMAEIIDLVGGLKIEITEAEAQNMMQNNIIKPVKAGKRNLDGAQCVAYARVRKVDSDYYRAGRQQKVLTLLFNKLKKMDKAKYPSLIKSFLQCVETSLSYADIIKFANSIDLQTAEIVKNTIPDAKYEAGLWGGTDSTGSWVWVYDLDAAAARLRKIIYGGFNPDETVAPGPSLGPSTQATTSASSDGETTYYGDDDPTTNGEYIPEETSGEEQPTAEPMTEEPTTAEPTTQEPTTAEPTTEEPATEEPPSEEPSSEEPPSEEPSSEEAPPEEEDVELSFSDTSDAA